MALWTVHGNGRRSPDDESDHGNVGSDERLSWPLTFGLGLQHLVAMFAATTMVPRLTGLPVSTTLLASGIGTLLFLLVTRNRVPAYLGSSMAFVVPMGAAAAEVGAGPGEMLGGILVVGLLVTAMGIAVKALGVRLLETGMPPVVTGAIVVLVGLSLAPHAVASVERGPAPAAITLSVTILLVLLARGLLVRGCVLVGIAAGWVYAALTGVVDVARLEELRRASWFGLPELIAPEVQLSVMPFVLPLVVVLASQQVATLKAVSAMTGRDLDGSVGDALIGGGLATTLSGSVGGSGLIGYAENIGVMAASRVYSTAACMVAAVLAALLAFSPKFAALVETVPIGAVGAVTILLLGIVTLVGVRIWLNSHVDFSDPVDLAVIGTALVAGVGDLTLSLGGVRLTGAVWGSLLIVLGYPLLRGMTDAVRGHAR